MFAGVPLVCNAVVAGALAASAYPKLTDRDGATIEIMDYRMVGPAAARVGSFVLPAAGLLASAGLLMLAPWGTALAAALLALYTAALLSALTRGLMIDCHCGPGADKVGWRSVARNAVLALALTPAVVSTAEPPLPSLLFAGCGLIALILAFALPHLRVRSTRAGLNG